jgi:hypothetical protein
MRRILGLAVFAAAAFLAAGCGGKDSIKAWCQNQVHVGDYLSSLTMPGAPHLNSVNNGVWTYDDGVKITFIAGQVYAKRCGF